MSQLPLLGGQSNTGLDLFLTEFLITIGNTQVWLSIGLALVVGLACLTLGIWIARLVGLLPPRSPSGETIAVGLATGLIVTAGWWAAARSGGRSSFTPVAIGFALAILMALVARKRGIKRGGGRHEASLDQASTGGLRVSSSLRMGILAAGLFIVVAGLVFGSTLAPSPRDGVQPVEFSDEAFYAVLGRDLATTGTETNLLPSGFSELTGSPAQTWYHWAEIWLAAGVISLFGTAPLAARYLVVLPVVLLAAAALTATIVRKLADTRSRRAYLFGFAACLVLAPVPLPFAFFGSWAAGLAFGINLYGLGAVAALLAMYGVAVVGRRRATLPFIAFVSSAAAFMLPAHIVLTALAVVGMACVAGEALVTQRRVGFRRERLSPPWPAIIAGLAVTLVVTVGWGIFTSHGLGSSVATSNVAPFNFAWWNSIVAVYLGAGAFLMLPIGIFYFRSTQRMLARFCLGAMAILVVGALLWGARLSDFNMYHVFFGGLAVFAVPVTAAAAWSIHRQLQSSGRMRSAAIVAAVCGSQLALGVVVSGIRLQQFGPRLDQDPIPEVVLEQITLLPENAKIAYACRPLEEFAIADPRLLSIDAHSAHRVVPMCYIADVFGTLNGVTPSETMPAAGFSLAPQYSLYANAAARPTRGAVAEFLKRYGINYIYVDPLHPNSLVDGASVVARSGAAQVLRIR